MRPESDTHRLDPGPYSYPVHAAAFEFALCIYEVTASFPPHERFGMTGQLRRAATSIAANLAEGGARLGARQLHHFVGMAYGSASECDVLLRLCARIGYLNEGQARRCLELLETLSRQLLGILRTLRKRNNAADG